jgi:hypothetical protein
VEPELQHAGFLVLASFVPEESSNNFPILKIREGEYLFVWFSKFKDQFDYESHLSALANEAGWCEASDALESSLTSPPEILKLEPTARSQLHD